jgi:hypothetical protein
MNEANRMPLEGILALLATLFTVAAIVVALEVPRVVHKKGAGLVPTHDVLIPGDPSTTAVSHVPLRASGPGKVLESTMKSGSTPYAPVGSIAHSAELPKSGFSAVRLPTNGPGVKDVLVHRSHFDQLHARLMSWDNGVTVFSVPANATSTPVGAGPRFLVLRPNPWSFGSQTATLVGCSADGDVTGSARVVRLGPMQWAFATHGATLNLDGSSGSYRHESVQLSLSKVHGRAPPNSSETAAEVCAAVTA